MKNKLFSAFLLTAGLLALGAQAQTAAPAADAVAPAPSRIIYAPRLPSPVELTNVAAAQGIGVEKIDQTATQITVTYKLANGQLNTVAYQLLPTAASPGQSTVAAGTVAVPASPAPAVVYTQAAPAVVYTQPYPYSYYYAADPYYSPWGFYGPLAVGIGLGFGFHGGYYHGGGFYHGHGRW
jgi:hypothetical protein